MKVITLTTIQLQCLREDINDELSLDVETARALILKGVEAELSERQEEMSWAELLSELEYLHEENDRLETRLATIKGVL